MICIHSWDNLITFRGIFIALFSNRNSGVYVIIECTPGVHEYKYFIDGAWYHDPTKAESLGQSPPGQYGRYIPSHPSEVQRRPGSLECRSSGPIAPGIGTINQPPLLPPHLLQGILNMDTGVHCDPNLLPSPNHVIVNHLYALSIKDGVIVLSVITRYRQKFVSTVFYKPIQD
ncbi:5'-AMP-activated protein kinase, regulatory beta subunit [Paragonimus westermani]|uniref:5'-AMP-activated protein kinase subunit beta-1 n=1 Tax=Paragonimus westermani TaxID=34504 RepID=A0A5J4NJX0_9TREM|nr:5'-AMP-activated protein kinase, regulatory beta subunit [Paragonimus westermani]